MSHDDTNTSTYAQRSLSDVKKERKQYEQDAVLLNNRIKLLQIEEQKTWKQIEETKKKKENLEKIRKRNEEKARFKEQILVNNEREIDKNQKKVIELKKQIENSLKKNKKHIFESKKHAYAEIRNLRDQSLEQKYKFSQEVVEENKKRSKSVKVEHLKQAIRAKKLKSSIQASNKNDYLRRVNEEFQIKSQLENKVAEMEVLELELIKRLQNTQNIQQKVINDFEKIRKKPISANS